MNFPLLWLGIGNAAEHRREAGSPIFGSEIRPNSQPLEIVEPTWPWAKVSHCSASVPVRFARESASTVDFSFVSPRSRLRRVQRADPSTVLEARDRAAVVVHERHAGVPVLPGKWSAE